VKHTNVKEINPKTGKPYYYKDNPAAVKLRDSKRMYLNGKEVSKSHTLHKAGRYKSFQEAAFESLPKYAATTEGYVYILSNPAWDSWYKVGMAADISDRVSSYQTSSPLRDYNLEHYIFTSNRRETETKIHRDIKKIADEANAEWFKSDLSVIVDILNTYEEHHEQLEFNFG